MRKIALIVLAWIGLTLLAHSPARAAEGTAGGFFGFKKFMRKAAPAAAAKKKPEKAASDTELTEEEKKLVNDIAAKVPAKDGAGLDKGNVKLPARILWAPPPKVPRVVAQNSPLAPPKNPNAVVIHLPKPPGRVPQVPVTSGPEKPPSAPKNN